MAKTFRNTIPGLSSSGSIFCFVFFVPSVVRYPYVEHWVATKRHKKHRMNKLHREWF